MSAGQALHSVLDTAGPQAARIATLFWLMVAVTGIVTLVVLGALAIAIVRGNRAYRGAQSRLTHAEQRATAPALTRIVAWSTGATVLILFGLLLATMWTQRATASSPTQSALTVNVIGHQFWWEIEYDDPQPDRRVQTANEIHIPVNRPVVLKVTSRDVIHSFWAPNLQGKRDLIPGYTTAIWLQADRAAVYRGQCAEFCGKQHAHMAFEIIAEPAGQFERWLDAQRAPSVEPQTSDRARGRDVFMTAQCVLCHAIRGTSAAALAGPNLTHVASRGKIAAATLPNTADRLDAWIAHTQSIKPGSQMPPTRLTDDDRRALVDYLGSLK